MSRVTTENVDLFDASSFELGLPHEFFARHREFTLQHGRIARGARAGEEPADGQAEGECEDDDQRFHAQRIAARRANLNRRVSTALSQPRFSIGT